MGKLYHRLSNLKSRCVCVLRAVMPCGVLLGILLWSGSAWTGGALNTNINGLPKVWDMNVPLNPEQGALKPGVYDNAASIALVQEALNTWTNVPTVNLISLMGDPLSDGGDTHSGNYKTFYNSNIMHCYDEDPGTPCVNPILFDADGSIIDDMFGKCSYASMVGFAGYNSFTGDSDDPAMAILKRGYAVFSGACIAPAVEKPGCPPCNRVLTEEEVRAFIQHETGHLLGLGHASVNTESYETCVGSGSCPEEMAEHIPTMHPLLVPGANQQTLHRDDEVSMQRLYGDPDAGHCKVSGQVINESGQEMRGVEVIARNINPSLRFEDAIAYVSGEQAPRIDAYEKTADNCLENCGNFEISGLQAGQTYQLCVSRLSDKFTGTRFVAPVDPPRQDLDHDCPEGLTFSCECSGAGCSEYTGVEITTRNTGQDYSFSQLGDSTPRASGCSLISNKEDLNKTSPWLLLRNLKYMR